MHALPPPTVHSDDSVEFVDHDGKRWRAREVDCRNLTLAPRRHCLIFEAMNAAHRVWTYPDQWRTLSTEGLVALLSAR